MLRRHDTALLVSPIAKSLPDRSDCDYIGIDTGFEQILKAGKTPLFAIGDFDSSDSPIDPKKYDFPFLIHPVAKDETDSELALLEAKKMGYSTIILYGALGGRLDHTLANLRCLLWKVPQTFAMDETHRVSVLLPGTYEMKGDYPHISFFAAEPSIITLDGFDYPLYKRAIDQKDFYTCSNSISSGQKARVILEKGRVLCVETANR